MFRDRSAALGLCVISATILLPFFGCSSQPPPGDPAPPSQNEPLPKEQASTFDSPAKLGETGAWMQMPTAPRAARLFSPQSRTRTRRKRRARPSRSPFRPRFRTTARTQQGSSSHSKTWLPAGRPSSAFTGLCTGGTSTSSVAIMATPRASSSRPTPSTCTSSRATTTGGAIPGATTTSTITARPASR
jgi:hypothetical protein